MLLSNLKLLNPNPGNGRRQESALVPWTRPAGLFWVLRQGFRLKGYGCLLRLVTLLPSPDTASDRKVHYHPKGVQRVRYLATVVPE